MLNSVIRLFVYPILVGTIISCTSGNAHNTFIASQDTLVNTQDTPSGVIETAEIEPNFRNFPLDFNNDTAYLNNPARILTTGEGFHSDEVHPDDAGRSWYGIFMNIDGYYLDSTRILTKRVEDPLGEEKEGEYTGWQVKTTNPDTSLLLISGTVGLSKRKIVPVAIQKKEVLPGESTTFSYNGNAYTLYATGNRTEKSPDGIFHSAINYRLFIKATINGTERKQLLAAYSRFDDAMVEILFAGDIDGDAIPDLILNTSYHYNAIVPTLYLSKPASGGNLLKVMGWHVSVGC